MNTRRRMAKKWTTLLCPEQQKFLNKNTKESFSLSVKIAIDDIYEVFAWRTIAVHPSLRLCTCLK